MNVAALGSDAELRLCVYFWFRLFNVAPETTARFSYLDIQRRDQSPPCVLLLFGFLQPNSTPPRFALITHH